MSQPPNPNFPHTQRGAPNAHSQALNEYNKIAATGQFLPATSSTWTSNKYAYTPTPTAAPSATAYLQVPRESTAPPVYTGPYAAVPTGGPVLSHVPPRSNTTSPYDPALNGLPLPPIPRHLQTRTPPVKTSPYATHGGQQPAARLQPAMLAPPSRESTASPFSTSSQYRPTSPPPARAPAHPHALNLHMPQPANGSSAAHMPWRNNAFLTAPQPQLSPMAPGSITREGLCARFQKLLPMGVNNWPTSSIAMLSAHYANNVVSLGQSGHLGSEGLLSYADIFLAVGYEHRGTGVYMTLAVKGEMEVKTLLRSPTYTFKGGIVFDDRVAMQMLMQGFHDAAVVQLRAVQEHMQRSIGAGRGPQGA